MRQFLHFIRYILYSEIFNVLLWKGWSYLSTLLPLHLERTIIYIIFYKMREMGWRVNIKYIQIRESIFIINQ